MTGITNIPPYVPPYDPTNLSSSKATESGILNNIFNLINNMTSVLQNAAAAQANNLNFLSSWQNVYTNVMAQVPTFVDGSSNDVDGADSTLTGDLNRQNSAYLQTLQNRQSIIGDNAKALQSSIDQTNNAVDQQSNLGTTIIQEMSTLLSTMFH